MEDKKMLEEVVKRYSDTIIAHVDKQHNSVIEKLKKHDEEFKKINGCFDRLETAALENSSNIKDLKEGQKEIKKTIDGAVTNHEQRIRKVEHKVGI
ncbi:MAG: hypothetical protein ABIH08_02000 [Candidatus Omnitrophota bacterium]